MKIVVTGGAGFIGSHLSKRLLKENHELTIIDSLHPYYSPERKQQQLTNIARSGAFHFIEKDLLNREDVLSLFSEIRPEAVIHLAALPGVAYSIQKPLEYVDYDIKATINILEAAGKYGASQVVFASSSSVYGDQAGPFKEEMASGKVLSPYAASKFSAESFCHVYEALYGFQMKIVRLFTVYGPWVRPDMAIGIFLKKLLLDQEITIYGEGRVRDFTYIDDIVDGIYLSLTKLKQSKILNIGYGRPVSMEYLLNELMLSFPNMKVNYDSSRAGDVLQTWADISKAQRLLGYEPKVNIETGLAKTIAWAKENESYL